MESTSIAQNLTFDVNVFLESTMDCLLSYFVSRRSDSRPHSITNFACRTLYFRWTRLRMGWFLRSGSLLVFALIACTLPFVHAYPNSGISRGQLDGVVTQTGMPFSLFADAAIAIEIDCAAARDLNITVEWLIRQSPCLETRFVHGSDGDAENNTDIGRVWSQMFTNPDSIDADELGEEPILYRRSDDKLAVQCNSSPQWVRLLNQPPSQLKQNRDAVGWTECFYNATLQTSQCRNATTSNSSGGGAEKSASILPFLPRAQTDAHSHVMLRAPRDGIYLIVLRLADADTGSVLNVIGTLNAADKQRMFYANVTVTTKHDYGYLSAVTYPLLPFYGIMSLTYACLGVIWLALCAHKWRDLIRIQLWIGMVIFIGMMEKALFYIEFETLNNTGYPTAGFAIVIAELMSAFKKSLSRMLIVIVSIGFGITRPRLGQDFGRVVLIGILYFIFASVEAIIRLTHAPERPLGAAAIAVIPLTILDTLIWYWVFTALLSTIRALRARRNVVKLQLFVSFMNTLAIAVLASLCFQVWSIWVHHRMRCIMQWKTLWLDEAFWHVLFSAVLLVIMLLWRPTENSQRFAFTMLLEEDVIDDAEAETVFLQELHSSPSAALPNGNAVLGSVRKIDSLSKSASANKSGGGSSAKKHDFTWTDERLPQSITEAIMSECGAGSDDDEVELMTSSRRHRDAQAKMD